MVAALDGRGPEPGRPIDRRRARPARPSPGVYPTRSDALGRIAAELSGRLDLDALFADVLDHSTSLFAADQVGLWLLEEGQRPLRLAAQRGLSEGLRQAVASLTADDPQAFGLRAIRQRSIRVMTSPARQVSNPRVRRAHVEDGIRTICFVPVVFRGDVLGLLVLYHLEPRAWPQEELELARGFADQMAIAIQNARLYASATGLAARLRAIQDLALRLDRIKDVRGIGEAIVAEARTLIDYDNIRVYVVDHGQGTCEPIAFQGTFMGVPDPDPTMLRVRVGEGLTGWVAEHNESLIVGNAEVDRRRVVVGPENGPESLLLVPMSYEGQVRGVVVVSKLGRDRFTRDDEMTLSIFAGYAAQAIANAESHERLQVQQQELEHQLASQRRLIEVNERLLSTLDPQDVLEMIADSLKAVVDYDVLAIYRIDREAHVRRAVVARDRFADVIMNYEGPLDVGLTGWVIGHGEAVLANDGHLDPRSTQIPGTPFEPESMIIVPLQVHGEVIGTLNIGRVGEAEAHFSQNEFELTKLFAGQASIALQNAEVHRDAEVRAECDALTGLRNHGSFQRALSEAVGAGGSAPFAVLMMDLDRFKEFNDARGHPAGDRLLQEVGAALRAGIRADDEVYRYGGDEFAAILSGASRPEATVVSERIRTAVATLGPEEGPRATMSVGIACFPDDGQTKDELVHVADAALYLAKPSRDGDESREAHDAQDAYLTALNETALLLMDHLDPTGLLETIMQRAGALMGSPHSYLYLADGAEGVGGADGAESVGGGDAGGAESETLVVRLGTGLFESYRGYRMRPGAGVAGTVYATGQPFAVDDYDAYVGRATDLPSGVFGSVVGVPLTSGASVVGVIGLASGSTTRVFGEREIGVLRRFAQLASIALDNSRLFDAAQREVTERARAEEALRASEERFRQLSDATSEALALHRQGVLLEVNKAFCRLFGYEPGELVGRTVLDLAAPESRRAAMRQIRSQPERPLEVLGLHRDGTTFPIEVVGRTIPYIDGQPARVASIRDLRERRALEERLTRQALYDGVTGLPNRELLMDRLGHSLAFVRSEDQDPIALILLDLDRFKVINESLGHAVGDELLAAVGRRLGDCIRPGDTVARSGGDEFGLLLEEVHRVDEARRVAERIDMVLRAPFEIGGRQAFITASMGIVLGRSGQSSPGEMLRDAEIALYRAKADASVRHAVFEPSMSAKTLERLDLENDLRRAIESEELVLHYQPLVDLETDRIMGIEALVRWQHPTRGLLPPMSFIPLAEETGLILPLGRWILATACRQTRTWQLAFPAASPLVVSVNLSARQFAQPDLVHDVRDVLGETGIPPRALELEITESVVMDQTEAGTRALHALRDLGVRLVLDDFGTGYSSLSYLKALPLDTIKIDRSFISGLDRDGVNRPIVLAVISLAHGLGIDVTAEGIETAEQLAWLRGLDCDRGQGFFYARPLPADAITELLGRIDAAPVPPAIGTRAGVSRRDRGRTRVSSCCRRS